MRCSRRQESQPGSTGSREQEDAGHDGDGQHEPGRGADPERMRSGGGAPVGRRWRAVRCAGTLPGGPAGETVRSVPSLIAHASPQEEPLRVLRDHPIMRSPTRFG